MSNKQEIIRKLTDLRNHLAERTGKERFKILQNRTIDAIAETMPQSLEKLSKIKGIGPKKLEQFGEMILGIVTGKALEITEKEIVTDESGEIIYTVSDFLSRINEILYSQNVLVLGEITTAAVRPSGVFLTLKDKEDESVMNCYMRPYVYQSLGIELEDGMEVKIGGFPSIYKPNGRFSFNIQTLELAGEGSLKKAYELLKKKLEAEGLFVRKRPLPEFIKRIGIITSKTGAVINDFRGNLDSLGFELFLYDVRVEGVRAVDEILEALKYFGSKEMNLDILVVIRGGGSLEDLQAFNNELVAREIFASKIPTIVAIGHDKDVPIASLVGDVITSTPTAAAHEVNKSWERLRQELPIKEREILYSYERQINSVHSEIKTVTQKMLGYLHRIFTRFKTLKQHLIETYERALTQKKERLLSLERYLVSVNPERNLKLGYSIVTDKSGKVIKEAGELKVGETLKTRLYKGKIKSKIEEIEND